MVTARNSGDAPFVRKLDSMVTLSEDGRQALLDLPMQVTAIKDKQDIVREGDRPTRSCLLLEGFSCAYKTTGDGKRQLLAINIAGDIVDLQTLHLEVLDHSVTTLSPCRVGFIQHDALRDLCERHPRIASALWRDTLVSASIFREWLLNVGRREAQGRMAHLLCEIVERMRAIGLAEDYSAEVPLTQSELADALGISTVHVNRVLQQLRAVGLIELRGERLNVPDWKALKHIGDFDPAYLHLKPDAASA